MSNKLARDNSKKIKQSPAAEVAINMLEYVICVLGIAIGLLVPLYLKNGYHGVGDCKFELYKWILILGAGCAGFALIVTLLLSDFKISIAWNRTDLFVGLFLVFAFFSAVAGGNFSDCMRGYSGWYMGFLSLLSFAFLYVIFSKYGKYYKAVLAVILCTALLTYIIGILHRLMIDPIGVYGLNTAEEIADSYKNQFLSTLGQASWYSGYVCTILPLGIGLFYAGEKKWHRITAMIFTLIGFMTMITQNSDSAYSAMIGFMLVFFAVSVDSSTKFLRFFEIVVLFFTSTRVMNILYIIHPNDRLKLDSLSNFLLFHPLIWGIWVLVLLLCILLWWCDQKGLYSKKVMHFIRWSVFIIAGVVLISVILILVLGAKQKLPPALANLADKVPYLKWSDKWGNGRGQTWAFSAKMYGDMDLFHKLFGVGPDGYAPYAYNLYQERLQEMWGSRTLTNAHNEWLNSLINYGLAGVVIYLGIFVSAFRRFIMACKDNPYIVGFAACIVSYACHNLFCYQTVCCTPFIFILIGIGCYIIREK